MILVTGTGRCGTSMWMQVLAAAGYPVVGEAFPGDWGDRLAVANPRGFFESTLVHGINFTTNPDPTSGARLAAAETRDVVAKVFLAGVVRTDRAFLDRVIVTVRDWRAVVGSFARLDALERGATGDASGVSAELVAIRWFVDHAALIEDALRRGYPARFVPYEDVLAHPERHVAEVLAWLHPPGEGPAWEVDLAAAVGAIDPTLRTQPSGAEPTALPGGGVAVFDELYARLRAGRVWAPDWLARLRAARAAVEHLLTGPARGAGDE